MAKITELKSREGGRHWMAKKLLFDFINEDRCKFVTDKGVIDIKDYGWTYASMEAFVTSWEYGGEFEHAPSTGHCGSCGFDIFGEDDRFKDKACEFQQIVMRNDSEKESYHNDPCNLCKYNSALDVKYIFDIALWREGRYSVAVEIVNTSPVKEGKLKYCNENGIDLIIVDYSDVIKESGLPPAHFKAKFVKAQYQNSCEIGNRMELESEAV